MALNGTSVLLLANTGTAESPTYEAVGSQRGVTFDEATAEIDVSSKNSRAKKVLPGRYSGSLSLDALYVPDDAAYAALKTAMRDGTLILVAREESDVVTETVDALITTMSSGFPDQGEATISLACTIDGFWTDLSS